MSQGNTPEKRALWILRRRQKFKRTKLDIFRKERAKKWEKLVEKTKKLLLLQIPDLQKGKSSKMTNLTSTNLLLLS